MSNTAVGMINGDKEDTYESNWDEFFVGNRIQSKEIP